MTTTGTDAPRRPLAVLGGYGGVNTGDEMILRAAVRLARRKGYRDGIAVICGRSPSADALDRDYRQRDLQIASWRNIPGAIRATIGRDLFIGGGQIIDGLAGIQYPSVQAGIAAVARVTGGKVVIGGVSTARLETAAVRRAYRLLFRLANRIVPRDNASAEDIVAMAPEAAAKVDVRADLVFALADEMSGAEPAAQRRTVAFAVHHSPTLRFSEFDRTLDLLRRLSTLKDADQEIAVLAHDMRADWDVELGSRLVDAVNRPDVTLRTLETTDACIAFYQTVRTIISARMHPIILGACAGSYCVPLSGSRKIADISERLKLPVWDPEQLMRLSDDAFRAAAGLDARGPAPSPEGLQQLTRDAENVW